MIVGRRGFLSGFLSLGVGALAGASTRSYFFFGGILRPSEPLVTMEGSRITINKSGIYLVSAVLRIRREAVVLPEEPQAWARVKVLQPGDLEFLPNGELNANLFVQRMG